MVTAVQDVGETPCLPTADVVRSGENSQESIVVETYVNHSPKRSIQDRRQGEPIRSVLRGTSEVYRDTSIRLYPTSDVTVEARSSQRVPVTTTEPLTVGADYYVWGAGQTNPEVRMCNGFVKSDSTTDTVSSVVLVTNFSDRKIRLRKQRVIGYAEGATLLPDKPTSDRENHTVSSKTPCRSSEEYTQDIRLTSKYLSFVERELGIVKSHFREACYNGGDIVTQHWKDWKRVWANPPWEYCPLVVSKILRESPREFIFVLPVPRNTTSWYTVLNALPIPSDRRLILPRSVDKGYFQLWYDGRAKKGPPLPFPEWDVEVIHGFRKDVEGLSDKQRTELLKQLCVNDVSIFPVMTSAETSVEWLQGIEIGNLTLAQQQQLLATLANFKDVLNPERIGCTTLGDFRVALKDGVQPIAQRPYPYSLKEKQLIEQEIQKMLGLGIIEPSTAPWCAPVVLVKKKDGSIRFCVDYRQLNAVTIPDTFPLPRLDETFEALAGNSIFSTLDLKSGYWQVPLATEDRDITTFGTHQGLYRWTRAPFGLRNMPSIFQRMMTRTLQGLTWISCLIYIDDIIIFGRNFDEHLSRLTTVLERLRVAGLTVSLEKCRFAMDKVQHLGHIVSGEGIAPDPKKIRALVDLKAPTNVKGVQQLLGMSNWFRRFIPQYSQIAAPLYELTRKETTFNWTPQCEASFVELKRLLSAAPVLRLPDPNRPFVLMTDASDKQIGAVLLQADVNTGDLHVIEYMSHTLNVHQCNYSTVEKECLALVWAIQENRKLLYGQKFVVRTDHRPLQWLMTKKELTPKLTRWSLTLQEYDFVVVYGPGKENVIADALSRLERLQPVPCNSFHEIDMEAPELVCLPSVLMEAYRDREVEVPGVWFGTAWATQNHVRRSKFRMKIVQYLPNNPLNKRWELRLPANTTPNQLNEETYFMSQRGLEAYIVGDQIRPPTHPQAVDDMTAEEPDDGNGETQPVEGDAHESITDVDEVRQVALEELRVSTTTAAADHVSRPLTVAELRTSQRADPDLQPLIQYLEQEQRGEIVKPVKVELVQQIIEPLRVNIHDYVLDEQGLLIHVERTDTTVRRYFRQQLVIPEELIRERVLHWHHGSSITAHQGVSRTYQTIRERYYWRGLRGDVYRYVMACKCQGLKVKKPIAAGDDGHLESAWPNDLVVVDCAGPLPETTHGNK